VDKEPALSATDQSSPSTRMTAVTWMAIASVMFCDFLSSMDAAIVSNILPRIAADLNGMPLFAWAATGNLLGKAVATLLSGKLSDMFGRRLLLLVSLALFAIGAMASAFAPSFKLLIAFRTIEGLGTGALVPISFMVVADLFSSRERGKWASTLNIASMVGFLVGPILGGVLTDSVGWRWAFAIGMPFVALSAIFAWFGLRETGKRTAHQIDYLGSTLMISASIPMLLGLSWGGSVHAWSSPLIIGLLGSSAVLWVFFLRVESRAAEPMLSTRVLGNRVFLTGSFWSVFSAFGLGGLLLYLPLFLQGVQGMTASQSGWIVTPYNVLFRLMAVFVGLLLTLLGRYKIIAILGSVLYLISVYFTISFNGGTSIQEIVIVTCVIGLAFGTMPTLNTIMIQNSFPKKLIGEATGGVYFFATLGQTLAPALLGTIMTSTYASALKTNLPAQLPHVFDAKVLATLNDPRTLLNATAMANVQKAYDALGPQGTALLQETLAGMRLSLEMAISTAFFICTICAAIGLIIIATVPNNPLSDKEDQPVSGKAEPRARFFRRVK
jgi:EmrB/QacA subfamily drug resistance transporter